MVNIEAEELNKEYEGMCFDIQSVSYRSRLAKKTPTKKGYFVVFWTKDEFGKNRPFTREETKDKLIVLIDDGDKQGQFIFPKAILEQKGIVTSPTKKGKMAMRVYPSWEDNLNAQATQTQKWQSEFFIRISEDTNLEHLEALYR